MKVLFFTCLLFLSVTAFPQFGLQEDTVTYFDKGVAAMNIKDYHAADSLFSLSFNSTLGQNALYNLALSRILGGDPCRACDLLNLGNNLFDDPEIKKLEKKYCIERIDTLYFDKKHRPIKDPAAFKYMIEETHYKCDSHVNGSVHKKGHVSSYVKDINSFSEGTNDIFATFFIIDSVRIFNFIYDSSFDYNNESIIDDFEIRLENYLKYKYDFTAVPSLEAYAKISFVVDDVGKVISWEFTKFPTNFVDPQMYEEVKADVDKAFKKIYGLRPELLWKEGVCSLHSSVLHLRR